MKIPVQVGTALIRHTQEFDTDHYGFLNDSIGKGVLVSAVTEKEVRVRLFDLQTRGLDMDDVSVDPIVLSDHFFTVLRHRLHSVAAFIYKPCIEDSNNRYVDLILYFFKHLGIENLSSVRILHVQVVEKAHRCTLLPQDRRDIRDKLRQNGIDFEPDKLTWKLIEESIARCLSSHT